MRQVDAGREHVPPGIARVRHRVAAQHRRTGRRVECGEIDRGLEIVQRGFVLGVEEARVAQQHQRGVAQPPHAGRRQLHRAVAQQLRQQRLGLRPRQQHGVAQMPPAVGIGENVRQQHSLVDLQPVLVGLAVLRLRRHLRARRHQAGHALGRRMDEVLDAQEARQVGGERAIEGGRVRREETLALAARLGEQRRRLRRLGRRARAACAAAAPAQRTAASQRGENSAAAASKVCVMARPRAGRAPASPCRPSVRSRPARPRSRPR